MAKEIECISQKDFNIKFKNYLRDFYVYQFKNKQRDFYTKGSFTMARMIGAAIICYVKRLPRSAFLSVRIKDISLGKDKAEIVLPGELCDGSEENEGKVVVEKPLCEILRYLSSAEGGAYFLTGNTGKPNCELFDAAQEQFEKECESPRTEENMYRYWGGIFLDEANENIKTGTYRNDSQRLQSLIKRMANVEWKKGESARAIGDKDSCGQDSCVECITADARKLDGNPFHILYRFCNRYSNDGKNDYFALVYGLVLYFRLGNKVSHYTSGSISSDEQKSFDQYLKKQAAKLFNKRNSRGGLNVDTKSWENLTPKQRERYAQRVAEDFLEESLTAFLVELEKAYSELYGENRTWEKISDQKRSSTVCRAFCNIRSKGSVNHLDKYVYLINNRRRIVYNGEGFELGEMDYVDRRILYFAMSPFINCGEKQLSNILGELCDCGIIKEYRELNVRVTRSLDGDEEPRLNEAVEECFTYEYDIKRGAQDHSYCVYYSNDADFEEVCRLKEALEQLCGECKAPDKAYYKLGDCRLWDMLGADKELLENFSKLVSFFSQTEVLGEVGSYILSRLPVNDKHIYYKHNYIIRALNDYNNIDLLYAIKNEKWVEIEYRDGIDGRGYQHFVCYPLQLRENTSNGKQYLIYYHPTYRSVGSVEIEFIDKITVGTMTEKRADGYFRKMDIQRAISLVEHTWGVEFGDFYEGNVKNEIIPSRVKIAIKCDAQTEGFIRSRLQREFGSFEEEKHGEAESYLTVVANVVNPWDMLHFIKSYTVRIISVEIQYDSFMNDVKRFQRQIQAPLKEIISDSLGQTGKSMVEGANQSFVPQKSISNRLFHEIYCEKFDELGNELWDMLTLGGRNTWSQGYFMDKFTALDCKNTPMYEINNGDGLYNIKSLMPIGNIEAQWLLNILTTPQARVFLTSEEIERIKKALPHQKLFDVNSFILTDRYSDRSYDDTYKCPEFVRIMRKLDGAIKNSREIKVEYSSQYGRSMVYTCAPAYIEYSRRDNRFRLIAYCSEKNGEKLERVITLSLDGVKKVELLQGHFEREEIDREVKKGIEQKTKKLYIYFDDIGDVPNKILNEFSCCKKECIKWGNGRYRMTLFYNEDDTMEITVRLLGYGSLISLWSSEGDDPVINELSKRLDEQNRLFDTRREK